MDPIALLQNIYDLIKSIKEQAKKVQGNQQQCQRLAQRIQLITDSLKGIDATKPKAGLQACLTHLQQSLQEALDLMKEYSQKSWFKRLLNAGSDETQFAVINHRIAEAMQQLQLGISAKQFINAEEDRQDREADMRHLKAQQAEILQLNKQVLGAVQQQPQIIEAIIAHQFNSMERRLNLIVRPGTAVEEKREIKGAVAFSVEEQIASYDLVFEKVLAKGSYGQMFQGKWNDQVVAIRWHNQEMTKAEMKQFTHDAQRLLKLRHPGLLSCYGVCIESPHAGWVLPYYPDSQITTVLAQATLSTEQRKTCGKQLLNAVKYLHQQNIVHSRIIPTNLFLLTEGSNWQLKLGESYSSAHQSSGLKATKHLWLAPECREGQVGTIKSDVYQSAAMLAVLISGQLPGTEVSSLTIYYKRIVTSLVDPAAKQLLSTLMLCWVDNPNERPALSALFSAYQTYQSSSPVVTSPQPKPEPAPAVLIKVTPEAKPTPKPAFFQPETEDPITCYNLGQAFQYGDGKKKDLKEAVSWYKKAAEKQHAAAQCELGMAYFQGDGIEKDPDQAFKLFQKSAPSHAKSLFMLGYCHERGRGAVQDYKKALSYYLDSAKKGYAKAVTRYAEVTKHLGLPNNLQENAAIIQAAPLPGSSTS